MLEAMAKKKTTPEESVLVETAKKIGAAAGKIAAMVGAGTTAAPKKIAGKFVKKNKSRLPRREKKALQKKNAA
jgi:hypothetical protein